MISVFYGNMQIRIMLTVSVQMAPKSCMTATRNMGMRLFQLPVRYRVNFIMFIACSTSPSIARCKMTAQRQRVTRIEKLIFKSSFFQMSATLLGSFSSSFSCSLYRMLARQENVRVICIMKMKTQFMKQRCTSLSESTQSLNSSSSSIPQISLGSSKQTKAMKVTEQKSSRNSLLLPQGQIRSSLAMSSVIYLN